MFSPNSKTLISVFSTLLLREFQTITVAVLGSVFSIQNYDYSFFLASTCIRKVVSMNPLQKNDYF